MLDLSVFFEGSFPYWNNGAIGKRRADDPWTPEKIADDSGMLLDDVKMYLGWLQEPGQAGLTNHQLADKFAAGYVVVRTGFIGGDYIEAASVLHDALRNTGTVGAMSIPDFEALLARHTGK